MKTFSRVGIGFAVILILGWIAATAARRGDGGEFVVDACMGRIEVATLVDGYLESRNVTHIMSQLGGAATIVEAVPDGTYVKAGETVVRFDSTQLERDVLRLERDLALAREEVTSLINAKLPMELRDMENRLAGARERYADESQTLADDRDMVKEDLLAEKDLKAQEMRVAASETGIRGIEEQIQLTTKFLHPAMVERAKATLYAATQEYDLAKRQLSNSTVRAEVSGLVGYRPLAVGGDFRQIRIGDTVFKNQPFMTISDMSNQVMYCEVPEAELTRFAPGCAAQVNPVAFPDTTIVARVDSVGASARVSSARGGNQKVFTVTIRLEQSDARLRSGMSAQARVVSQVKDHAVLIPRIAVAWEGGVPVCLLREFNGVRKVKPVLGLADDINYEVVSGIKPGDRLVVR